MTQVVRGELIGTGGTANVYMGYRDGTKVAVKEPLHLDQGTNSFFFAEAGKMAEVSHENVLEVFAVENAGGKPRIVMEWADGGTLGEVVRRGPTPPAEVLDILEQVLRGLRAVHAHGIVHRDVKPCNILRVGDVYKIGDFGIAKLDQERTVPYVTWKYCPPEGEVRSASTPASDVYSLGLVAYELLLGAAGLNQAVAEARRRSGYPEPGVEDSTVWRAWIKEPEELALPHEIEPGLPEGLSRIAWRMALKNRRRRYSSCDEVLRDIEAFRRGETIELPPPDASGHEATERVPDLIGFPAAVDTGKHFTANVPPPPSEPRTGGETAVRRRRIGLLALAAMILVVAAAIAAWWTLSSAELAERAELRRRGLESLERRDYAAAAEELEALLRMDPQNFEVALAAAKAHYQLSNYGEAEASLRKLAEDHPAEAIVFHELGLVDLARERYRQAVRNFGKALDLAGGDPPTAHFYLAYAYYHLESFDVARTELEEFLLRSPEHPELADPARKLLSRPEVTRSETERQRMLRRASRIVLEGFRRPSTRLDSVRGSVVVLHFWASWCSPCLVEMPSLARFFEEEYPALEKEGLKIVTVSHDYEKEDLERYVDRELADYARSMPIYWDPRMRLSESLELASSLPQTLILDRRGRLRRIIPRPMDWQAPGILAQLRAQLSRN